VSLLRFVYWFVASLMIISFAPSAIAQETQDYETGLNPYQSYQSGNIDSINLFNRGLNVDIPLISYPQRGGKLHLDFDLHYINQGNWYNCTPGTNCSSFYGTGLTNGFGVILKNWPSIWGTTCQALGDQYGTWTCQGSATMSDGSSHSMQPITLSSWESQDTSGFQMDGTELQANNNPPLLIDANGTRYNQTYTPSLFPGPVGQVSTLNYVPTLVEDVNGNEISYSQTAGWTDTMGRQIPLPVSANTSVCPQSPLVPVSAYTWNLPGVNGGTYPITFCYVNVAVTQHWDGQIQHISLEELQTVLLPNATSWTFQYTTDGNGDLSQITFPTGGTLSYTWTTESPVCGPHYYDNARAVVTRTLNPNDGVSPPGTWKYSGLSNVIPVVTDPASNDTVHTYSALNPNACPYYETETQYYQGSHTSGTLLKTVSTAYQPLSSSPYLIGLGQPSQTETLWANNQENETAYAAYDSALTFHNPYWVSNTQWSPYMDGTATGSYGLLETKKDYDYGSGAPGTLLRTTSTTYEALSNSNYLNNNILNIPASVAITGLGPGSSTTYNYDENNGSPQGARGNVTSIHRWLNTSSSYLVTNNVYNSNGLLTSSKDPKTNPTTYGYSPSSCPANSGYAGSGPTSVTNALSQTTYYCYDLHTGLLVSTTDPNNQTVSYAYDEMERPIQQNNPDRGQVTYTYTDTTPSPSVNISMTTSSTGAPVTGLEIWDGLGRLKEKVLTSDPSGYDYTAMIYDALGRPYQVYNPTRCSPPTTNCGPPTWGFTQYAYDALSRVTRATHRDGSFVQTSYIGRATEVSDEGNGTKSVARISQVDGLGRLASICEVSSTALTNGSGGSPTSCGQDISATGFLTTYQYDVLDNLTQVNQGSLNPRKFVFDSLSRLTSSTNPEANTVPGTTTTVPTSYSYDADGNVYQRIAPYPNQQGTATLTTTYSYDAVNRLIETAYSSGPTPNQFYYDATNHGYSIGRLTHASNDVNAAFDPSYDQMGRVTSISYCIPLDCNYDKSVSATYDYLGDVTSISNSMGVTLSYQYNGAAELNTVTSSLSDSNHPSPLFSGPFYNETALTSVTLGNGLYETRAYDSHLRLVSITDGSAYSLSAFPAPNDDILTANDSANGNWTYNYDDFNRLLSATNSTKSLAYTYGYDRYGNRWQQYLAGACTAGTTFCLTFDNNDRVNNGSLVYDTAGNVIQDSMHHYYYDAENRLIQVDGTLGTCSTATACYVYFPDGQRAEKSTAGVRVDYLYDVEGRQNTEVNSSLGWNRIEVYASGRHLATYSGGATGTTYFNHADWLGTERARTTVTGSLCETISSLPFGDGMSTSGSCGDPSPLHFTGYQRDTESGLDNAQARYLGSSLGRFMSPDPANAGSDSTNPQRWNMYSYALNSPLVLTDPTGLGPCEEDDDDPTCAPGTGNGYGYSYYPQPDFDIEALPQQSSTPSLADPGNTTLGGPEPPPVKSDTYFHIPGCPTSDPMCVLMLKQIVYQLKNSAQSVTFLQVVPVVRVAGIAYGVTVSHIPSSHTWCAGPVGGVATTGKSVNGGPLILGNQANAKAVLSGFSWNASAQASPLEGVQGSWNKSGSMAGPTGGTQGASVTGSYSWCW
jgi:RHS repeat-associated protein